LIEIGVISMLINIQNISVLIISKTYQVDRFVYISMSIDLEFYQGDRFWRHINVDKYPRHIKLIDLYTYKCR